MNQAEWDSARVTQALGLRAVDYEEGTQGTRHADDQWSTLDWLATNVDHSQAKVLENLSRSDHWPVYCEVKTEAPRRKPFAREVYKGAGSEAETLGALLETKWPLKSFKATPPAKQTNKLWKPVEKADHVMKRTLEALTATDSAADFDAFVTRRSTADFLELVRGLASQRVRDPRVFYRLIKAVSGCRNEKFIARGVTDESGAIVTEGFAERLAEHLRRLY